MAALVLPGVSKDPGGKGSLSEWLPDSLWGKCKGLEEGLPVHFKDFGDNLQNDCDEWREWFDSTKPEESKMPGKYADINDFQRLLILRALRGDRLNSAVRGYIVRSLGESFVEQAPFDMESTYQESSPATPIFFTLFPGVDPTSWVEQYGIKLGVINSGKYQNISMGQGQEERAEKAISSFAANGGWVFLQNIHLMTEWLPTLERTLEKAAEHAHQDFRCFLSAEPPSSASLEDTPGIVAAILYQSDE